MSNINAICEHGHLARKCEVCELKDRIRELEDAVKVLAKYPVAAAFRNEEGWIEAKNAVANNPIARAAIDAAKESA